MPAGRFVASISCLGAVAAALVAFVIAGPAFAGELGQVALSDLCVTNGEIKPAARGRLLVETPSSRAVLRSLTDAVAEIDFRYLGPSADAKPLASGELRRQIGLKLRAKDTCNLVYAMWHIEPDARIAVSIKRNPGMRTHEQCDAHGYINLKPTMADATDKIAPGEEHSLRAELHQSRLTVIADGKVAWSGDLGQRIFEFDGPVGMRSDNARFDFVFLAGKARGGASIPHCEPSAGD
jgi:hypothetical protein